MVHTGANPYFIHRHLPPMSQDAFCQILCIYSYVRPYSDKICEFTPFQAKKGGFWPPETKRTELGVVVMNLRWPSVSVIRKY